MKRDTGNKVIAPKNLPTRFPFIPTAVVWLVLDRLHAPQWLCAVLATIGAIWWIGCFVQFWQQKETDIFPEEAPK